MTNIFRIFTFSLAFSKPFPLAKQGYKLWMRHCQDILERHKEIKKQFLWMKNKQYISECPYSESYSRSNLTKATFDPAAAVQAPYSLRSQSSSYVFVFLLSLFQATNFIAASLWIRGRVRCDPSHSTYQPSCYPEMKNKWAVIIQNY